MDYDDDDISHHNLQLAGDSRSKSSSILRPYDFPKFDFDDSLQAHLRFDTLVETEVFLGIQSQEDNQWIEDFSGGSNGMEFNSTPADSCSISKRNNVWSEATSSESVEMLLKSVGQEEIMPKELNISASNVCHDSTTLANYVEPGSKLDAKKDENPANSEITLSQDKHVDHPSSKEFVEEQLPDAEEPPVTQENVESVSVKNVTSSNEGKHPCHEENSKEPKISAENPVNFEAGVDPLPVTGAVDKNLGMLSTSEMSKQVCNVSSESCNDDERGKYVCSGTKQEESKVLEGVTGGAIGHVHTADSSAGLVGESGVLKSQDAVEASGIADTKTDAGFKFESSQGNGKNVSSKTSIQMTKHEVEVLPINNEMAGSFEGCQDGSSMGVFNQQSAKQKMDSSVQLNFKRDIDNMKEAQTSASKGEGTYELPSISGDQEKALSESSDCIDTINISKSSEMVMLSSTTESSFRENGETKNAVRCHSDSLVSVEKSCTQLPTAILDDSKHGNENKLAHREAGAAESELDICSIKKDKEPPTDAENIDFKNVKTPVNDQITKSSVVSEGTKVKNVADHAKIISSAEQGDDSENAKRKPAVIGLSPLDSDHEEASARIASGVHFETEEVHVVKVEGTVAGDAARASLSEMDAKSSQTLEKNDDVSNSEPPSIEAIKCLSSNHSQVHLDSEKACLKDSISADLVSCGNHEATTLKVEREKDSEQAAEIDKASCGSPTTISSSEPSQMEKDNHEEITGNEARDHFVKAQPSNEDPQRKDATGDDSTFTFKVDALPDMTEREPGRTWSPFPDVEKCNSPVIVEETKQSGEGKTARTPKQKTPRQSVRKSDGENVHGTSKGTSERKGRRASAKGAAKENAKKGNQIRDTNTEGAKGDKVSGTLMSPSSSGTHVQLGKMQSYKHIEQSKTKLSVAATVPDLNNSAQNSSNSPSASFRQPFTDVQQVQLRAQIFVYGSLIQGTAPDEACMLSAFGSSDGRSIWEPVWRAAVERVRSQKSNSSAAETPLHPQSVARASDATVKQGSVPSKVLSSPVARTSSKGTPTTVVNPIIPLSSPLWNIATPPRDNFLSSGTHKGPVLDYQHAVSPLHSYQTPPIRNFVGHTSWPSQPCFPGPWLASPQSSTFNTSVHLQPVTMTETVKLTPVRDTSGLQTSSMKQVTSSSPQSATLSPVHVGASLPPDPKVRASAEGHSVDLKSRKRKKNQPSKSGQVSLSEALTEPVVDSNMASVPSSPVVAPASNSPTPASPASDAVLSKVATPIVAVCPADQPRKGNLDTGKVVTCSEETLSKVAEAKSQAEDAATLAATTVTHSEDLWKQLAKQKASGQTSELEAKLASAAVAISAAASVAKAAAAAAKVACNVALQAKLMADEAFHAGKTSGLIPSSGKYSADVHDIGNATPASILKGNNLINQSSSILLAAKEAAKRRVEAATAASKQAENLDAIVKAAELAAAAVSQAGKIVAMGEPLPLSDLIEAGPEGCWDQPSSDLAERSQDCNKEKSGATGAENSAGNPKGFRKDSGMKGGDHSKVLPGGRANGGLVNGIKHSIHTGESDFQSGKDGEASDNAKSSEMRSEPVTSPDVGAIQNDHDELVGAFEEDSIKEGSAVEVYKHGDGLKSAWYSANVLTLEDGKAYVRYTDLSSEEGSGNLCEWVQLKGEGDQAPVIRTAHPLTALQFQGTRKRRRAALGDYAWCVGDRVDVWIDDCWWEGVVTEKNEKDETTLKVHFPAHGETSTVRAWNLRTSRLWKDEKWFEWTSAKGRNVSEQSDTPHEKRQKLGTPAVPTKGKDKFANDVDAASGKPEESKLLDLSVSDRKFDVGKTTKEENKRAARRPLRTGQPKEGSRVVFGVPKPTGKKRKFMEVSKQFPANNTEKKNEANDSVKFAKFLMPQAGTVAQGLKASSRNDSKEKRTAESRPRVPSSRKSNRTLPQRNNLNSTLGRDDNSKDPGKGTEDSVGHDGNITEKSAYDFSAPGESVEAPLSSLIAQTVSSSSKKVPSLNFKSDRFNRGKPASSVGKLSKIEDKEHTGDAGKSVQEAGEPRRSNRRIQPTHRLLEGLQSSMIIPKMPSVSHDRGQRNPSRNVFARGK